ncbi:PREDICTED: olfactory receptor 10Q1-like [Thamnophis sirtalis]|uniref:Olfactory receptor n=1 Tax=Thamnophis sirtalis TaxID=35019 RepID=A0A6I9YB55_9SAUR|nr:PREDICTED: olfactory receptor 10Q1-like [Thamnophis sirtalis]
MYEPIYCGKQNKRTLRHFPCVNKSSLLQFIFQAFSTVPEIQHLIFTFFLLLYLIIFSANISILSIVCMVNSLHTPMYFFLASLSLLEICYITVIVPQMLASISDFHRTIPLVNCAIQMFFFTTLGSTDCFMLAVMAYDRYVAICHPLRYTLIMTWQVCMWLVIGSLILAIVLCLQLTVLVFNLPFCGYQPKINHFFCDVPPVLQVACADTHLHQTALYGVVFIVLMIPFVLICISYVYIVAAILRIKSSSGRHKAFSTCSSHLTVVFLQYGVCSLVYLRPKSSTLEDEDKKLALIYTFVTPFLNPLIYTLRNKDIKQALRKVIKKMVASQT